MEKSNTMSQISDYYPFPSYPQYQRESQRNMIDVMRKTPKPAELFETVSRMYFITSARLFVQNHSPPFEKQRYIVPCANFKV